MSGIKEFRAQVIARRKSLSKDQTRTLSIQITDRFFESCGMDAAAWKGKRVAIYRALPDELDLSHLQSRLEIQGAQLCFPRVVDRAAGELEFASGSGSGDWTQGPYGIQEPPAHFSRVNPEDLDVIFVPGVVFGLNGERIGMGGGYYDRYLPSASKALRVALAFDFQLFPKVEQEAWDQRMHWIWTEKREVRLSTRAH